MVSGVFNRQVNFPVLFSDQKMVRSEQRGISPGRSARVNVKPVINRKGSIGAKIEQSGDKGLLVSSCIRPIIVKTRHLKILNMKNPGTGWFLIINVHGSRNLAQRAGMKSKRRNPAQELPYLTNPRRLISYQAFMSALWEREALSKWGVAGCESKEWVKKWCVKGESKVEHR